MEYKICTSIEQSKKLIELGLDVKTADMFWFVPADDEGEFIEEVNIIRYKSFYNSFDKITDWNDTPYIPCWSLATLLGVLPYPFLSELSNGIWKCGCYPSGICNYVTADSPIDACYELILKLNELKMF